MDAEKVTISQRDFGEMFENEQLTAMDSAVDYGPSGLPATSFGGMVPQKLVWTALSPKEDCSYTRSNNTDDD